MYTGVYRNGNKGVKLRCVNKKTGKRYSKTVDFKPSLYIPTSKDKSDTRIRPLNFGHDSTYFTKKIFNNSYEMKTYIEDRQAIGQKIYGIADVPIQFIQENFNNTDGWDYNLLSGCIIDIEVESGYMIDDGKGGLKAKRGPFPVPELARWPITAITINETKTKRFIVLGLEVIDDVKIGTYKHDKDNPTIGHLNVEYYGCSSERELLRMFIEYMKVSAFDFISGWNSEYYDIPYISKRVELLLGEEEVLKLSPFNTVTMRETTTKFGKVANVYNWVGTNSLDYSELVLKHSYTPLENRKLETAGMHFLGQGKIKYHEDKTTKSLTDLYYTNYQKYIEYNIHDVNIVSMLNDELKYFELSYTLMYTYNCSCVKDTLGTVHPWSARSYITSMAEGYVSELKPLIDGHVDYLGGYVSDPKQGKSDWIVSIDANSLYPSMIIQYNMGVDTLIPRHSELYNTIAKELKQEIQKRNDIPHEDKIKITSCLTIKGILVHDIIWKYGNIFSSILNKHSVCIAPNGAMFSTKTPSIMSSMCDSIYSKRKLVKQDMIELKKRLQTIDDRSKEKDIIKQKIVEYHNLQMAYKIMINSLYGAIGNRHFKEHYDPSIAEAVTTCGQMSIMSVSDFINKYLSTMESNNNRSFVIYNDTDSVYISLASIVDKLEYKNDQQKVCDYLDNLVDNELEKKILEWANTLKDWMGCTKNNLVFKRESICPSGIWATKKRYILSILDMEGVRYKEPKTKIIGMEAIKASYATECRKWLVDAYEIAITTPTNEIGYKLADFVMKCRTKFFGLDPHEIAKPEKVNNIEKFYSESQMKGIKGTPNGVNAIYSHNFLVKEYGLDHIRLLESGDKILKLNLVDNAPYGIRTIAFDGELPNEFNLEPYIDYAEAFEISFLKPIGTLTDALGIGDIQGHINKRKMF